MPPTGSGAAALDDVVLNGAVFGKESRQALWRQGPGEEVSLPEAGPQRWNLRELVRLLDPFRDGLHVERFAELENRADQTRLVRACVHRGHERTIDLELVDRETWRELSDE